MTDFRVGDRVVVNDLLDVYQCFNQNIKVGDTGTVITIVDACHAIYVEFDRMIGGSDAGGGRIGHCWIFDTDNQGRGCEGAAVLSPEKSTSIEIQQIVDSFVAEFYYEN